MSRVRLLVIPALLLLTVLLDGQRVSSAQARSITWSGYTWDVRPPGSAGPGPNQWSDSCANLHVNGTELVLSIVKDSAGRRTSAEVDNQRHLGYGVYRWVVNNDLSTLDANEVLGMFTYDDDAAPSHNEIDIEPSPWGNLAWDDGSVTVWQDADRDVSQSRPFNYSNKPPYVNQFTRSPRSIHWKITDAAGAILLDWTTTSGVPTPKNEVPIISYWRFEDKAPAGVRSMRIGHFSWAPSESGLPPLPSGQPAPAPNPEPRSRPCPRNDSSRGSRQGHKHELVLLRPNGHGS